VERAFNIHISRSVSALAAPSFAAAAVGHKVTATIPVGNRVLIVAQETVQPGSWAEGRTIADVQSAFEGYILLVERANEPRTWCPSATFIVRPGDELALVATRKGLTEAVRITQPIP
jgi:Trk K+ transport system NAD-binding subunit